MKLYHYKDYILEQQDILKLFLSFQVQEDRQDFQKPQFGEIWICQIPILLYKEGEVFFQTMKRPVLIIDDGNEYFVKDDNKNYYVLKITSQKDSYHRIKLINYQKLGLQKESYVRIEIPLKVEKEQFLYCIGSLSVKQALKYLEKVWDFLQKKDET